MIGMTFSFLLENAGDTKTYLAHFAAMIETADAQGYYPRHLQTQYAIYEPAKRATGFYFNFVKQA